MEWRGPKNEGLPVLANLMSLQKGQSSFNSDNIRQTSKNREKWFFDILATATEYNQSKPLVLNFQLQFRFGMNINMVVTTLELNPMCSALFHIFAACASYPLPWVDSLLLSTLELSTSKTTFSLLHAIMTLQQMPFPYLHNLFATLFFFFWLFCCFCWHLAK